MSYMFADAYQRQYCADANSRAICNSERTSQVATIFRQVYKPGVFGQYILQLAPMNDSCQFVIYFKTGEILANTPEIQYQVGADSDFLKMESRDINRTQAFSNIHEHAVPVKGVFRKYIGTIKYIYHDQVYKTKIMTQTAKFKVGENVYNTVQGYIQIQPFISQFMRQNPQSEFQPKQIRDWARNNTKWIKSRCANSRIDFQWTIGIKGAHEIQGTYFHIDAFTHALEWACPGFKTIINDEFQQAIVQQNIDRKTELQARRENKQMLNPTILATHEQYTGVEKFAEDDVQLSNSNPILSERTETTPEQGEQEEMRSMQEVLGERIDNIKARQAVLNSELQTPDLETTRRNEILLELWTSSQERDELNAQMLKCIEEQGLRKPGEIYALRWVHCSSAEASCAVLVFQTSMRVTSAGGLTRRALGSYCNRRSHG